MSTVFGRMTTVNKHHDHLVIISFSYKYNTHQFMQFKKFTGFINNRPIFQSKKVRSKTRNGYTHK